MKNFTPIGILDSGIGGFTVAREIIRLLPHENIVYIGDRKNVPYGVRTKNEIYDLSRKMVDYLIGKNVKAIVVACNTVTVNCLDDLRKEYPEIPIIGTVPVIKTAAKITRNKRIGILSTKATASSDYQNNLIKQFAEGYYVQNLGTDKLVSLIERYEDDFIDLDLELRKVLKKYQDSDIDTLALGCTHFPYVKKQIQEILGSKVKVLDSGEAIARQVKRVLESNGVLNPNGNPKYEFYFTGSKIVPIVLINSFFEDNFSGRIKIIDSL